MKKILPLLFCVLCFSCDDGDFNIPALDFENQNIEYCGDIVLFKINSHESLIIELNVNSSTDFLLTEWDNEEYQLTESGSNKINYRIFNDAVSSNYFCQPIPPSTPTIQKEWLGTATLYVSNTVVNDDNDGVEETDLTLDTDNDGVPNYLDNDDDGDGVLTKNELDDEGVPLDTDNDGIDDYLDTDDDGDAVLTIYELLTDSDNDVLSIPDYLDANTAEPLTEPRDAIDDGYTAYYTMTFTLNNLVMRDSNSVTMAFEEYDFGTLTGGFSFSE